MHYFTSILTISPQTSPFIGLYEQSVGNSSILKPQKYILIKQPIMKSQRRDKIQSLRYASSDLVDNQDRLPSLRKYSTSTSKKDENFDKYYIIPNLRYKHKNRDPKNDPKNYQDETFVYKNMHNSNFWNWVHPLDALKLRQERNSIGEKVNRDMLQRFKLHLENKQQKRVPLLVQQILRGEI